MKNLNQKKYNIILDVDSYKNDHGRMLKGGVEFLQSSIIPRKNKSDIFSSYVIPFGYIYTIQNYLTPPITMEDVEEAEFYFKLQGYDFDRKRWEYIVKEHNGYLPLKINAVREGQHIPLNMPLVRVENTDPKCAWLVSYIETMLLRGTWYGTTVATNAHSIKKILKETAEKTIGDLANIEYHLHNFGARGGSSLESEIISSMAHAVSFSGSDSMQANKAIYETYSLPKGIEVKTYVGSVIASEHSVSCSNSNYELRDDFQIAVKMLDLLEEEINKQEKKGNFYEKTGQQIIVSIVSDTYDIYRFVDKYLGQLLKDRIQKLGERGGKIVVRPDSGDPTIIPIEIIKILMNRFGYGTNAKGYKTLPTYLGVLQGDGVNGKSIQAILHNLEEEKLSLGNLVFGMGGKLVMPVNGRDEYSFAMKATAQKSTGEIEWQHLIKDPITDSGKKSHSGHISTYKNASGKMIVAEIERMEKEQQLTDKPYWEDVLLEVFNNGKLKLENINSFEQIREEANKF